MLARFRICIFVFEIKRSDFAPFAARLEMGGVKAQTHGSAQGSLVDLRHEGHDWIRCDIVYFGGEGLGEVAHVARKLDDRDLHTEADPQIWYFIHSGKVRGLDHAFGASRAESSRNEDSLRLTQRVPGSVELGG